MPIRPGFVAYDTSLRSTSTRSAFCALSSLLPGTLPTGSDEHGALSIHCLDVDQPVAANLAEEEALFLRVLRDD
jgi:multicomponent Na+:H+ antiporter subunit E